ncbi:MAG: zinc ribbon domain-containing protein [Acidobacteria bacterium]|nr:zinc ribbon domain-containing protein [Acidobacteriota bacterium]MCA1640160.1 zinc ribbon domain-containing protein [Acidobacteriota bacterium]
MIQCQNCGQTNNDGSNFCRFCGTKFLQSPFANEKGYEFTQRHPYSWKTDELQVSESKARNGKQIHQVQPLPNSFSTQESARPQPLVFQPPQNMSYGYRCPRCASQLSPKIIRKISTTGWIVFAVLMVTFFPLFWIGLLIKEDVRVCSVCNMKIGK